jgi:hypothetical protein
MPFTLNAFNHAEWERHGLADFGEFADQITECNVGEDSFSGFGQWFFVSDGPLPNNDRVIYFGSWGNDNSPGASMYTNAEIFDGNDPDDIAAFSERVKHWESQPENVESDDDCEVEDESEEPWDEMLAQQELEDFEQADEYFGDYGEIDF